MALFHCVKCGRIAQSFNYQNLVSERTCAPACEDCRSDVAIESRKNFSMWPNDYYGGWIWSPEDGQWQPDGLLKERAFDRANHNDKWLAGWK